MTCYKRGGSIRTMTTAVVAATLLSGCLSEEANTTSLDALRTEVELSGSVGDGPIVGANMLVRADGGALLAEFQSDANAGYNITINMQAQYYPLTIEATGGTDLVTNTAPDFDMTGVLFESANNSIANVNPFSTFSVALARELSGGMTRENLRVAQEIVVAALNSGLNGLVSTGPIGTRIDETNISEIVKASETLAERVRRTRDLLQAAGFSTNGDQVVSVLASDVSDRVVDGIGGSNADRRTAAVSTIVNAQVLLESMANELHVNGSDATSAMRTAIDQVSPASPTTTIDELPVTAGMISKARVGLAAAYAVDADPAILQLHTVVSGIQPGQSVTLVGVILPAGYRSVLQNVLSTIASADDATLDLVNAVARTGGDINAANLAPSIQGVPASSVVAGSPYSFTPVASDANGDVLTFDIVNLPSWASFNMSTGELFGTPAVSDLGNYANIIISVSDGEFSASLAAFTITVTANNSAPQISGSAPTSVSVGGNYSFTPTASDPENDTLTFSVSGLPSWASFNTTTGRISGTPQSGNVGAYPNIVISVSDGEFSASLAAFTITVTAVASNSPPQISGSPATDVNVGQNYSFTPTASDPENDTLTFSVSGLPSWASFDTTTGQLSGSPSAAGVSGGIVISVSDGEFSASLAAFTITVTANNAPPQISGSPATDVNVGQNYSFTPTASDPENDTLTFSVSGLPSWASFNTSTGQISGTPQSGDVGTYANIIISVSDGQASASLGSFSVTVQAISLGSVTLTWTAPTQNEDGTDLTDLDGYWIYWGTTPGTYPNSARIDNESVLMYVVDNLAPGTYEFVSTSFNTSGVESAFSNTATKVVP